MKGRPIATVGYYSIRGKPRKKGQVEVVAESVVILDRVEVVRGRDQPVIQLGDRDVVEDALRDDALGCLARETTTLSGRGIAQQ